MAGPTVYADLNALLVDFVGRVRTILDANFCGAYLQGSFAVGDADEHSDVDFIVATHDEVTDAQLQGLQAMHEQLHALDVPWAQHLEGSYVPTTRLRRVDPSRSPYLYLDNGAKELIRDNHCNTAVVRWSLREHGVVLAGPIRSCSWSLSRRRSSGAKCARRCRSGRRGRQDRRRQGR